MPKIKNWSKIEGTDRAWENDKTGTRVGVMYNNASEKWEVATRNQLIDDAETKSMAKKKATKWMRNNPEPSAMF